MARRDSLIPEAHQEDVFGQHAAKAMKRILDVGWQAWIEGELASPSWGDRDWCRMILALSQGQEAKFEETRTYLCPKCKDTGSVVCLPADHYGVPVQVGKRCPDPCAWRMRAKSDYDAKQEQETGRRRRGRLDDELGLD